MRCGTTKEKWLWFGDCGATKKKLRKNFWLGLVLLAGQNETDVFGSSLCGLRLSFG